MEAEIKDSRRKAEKLRAKEEAFIQRSRSKEEYVDEPKDEDKKRSSKKYKNKV